MKAYPKLLFTFALLFAASILFSATYRSVDPLILPSGIPAIPGTPAVPEITQTVPMPALMLWLWPKR